MTRIKQIPVKEAKALKEIERLFAEKTVEHAKNSQVAKFKTLFIYNT